MNLFRVWCPDLGHKEGDAYRMYADSEEEAAKEWAFWYDRLSVEREILDGKEMKVFVRSVVYSSEISEWTVTGESVQIYSARPVLVQHI